jgi:hypothetical protein
MRKKVLVTMLLAIIICGGLKAQKTVVDRINDQLDSASCGTAYFTINYKSGSYTSSETVIVIKDSASSTNVRIRAFFKDTAGGRDTAFVLSSTQLTALQNFYQSASTNSNPDPSVSVIHSGTSNLDVNFGCAGSTVFDYSSSTHISLYRTILANWNNWYQ